LNPEISVVLPTYNERENLEHLIPLLENMIKKEKLSAELVVVDDSSPDRTSKLAEKLNLKYKNIRVIVRKKKEGLGVALIQGYNESKGKIIISIDVDSFGPENVKALIAALKNNADMVVGSRYRGKAGYEKKQLKTHIKHFVSINGNKLTKRLTGIDVSDYSLNCRAMTRECWSAIAKFPKEKGSAMLLEMIWYAHKKGFAVTDIPVYFKDRTRGKSKMNILKQPLYFFITLLKLVVKNSQ